MSVSDFLFEGKPPPQIESFGSTSASLPDWYSGFLRGNAAKANAVAGAEFQPYVDAQGNGIPRLAQFTPDQQNAFQGVREGYNSQVPGQQQAGALTNAAAGTSSLGAAQPIINNALSRSSLTAANPYLTSAAGTAPGAIGSYMSPYMDQVTNRIAELGNRNLTENLLPNIQDQFIAAGQVGSDRNAEFGSRAIRDTANEIAGQQSNALQAGYTTAGNLFNADQNRLAQIGQTTGSLATADTTSQENLARLTGSLTDSTANRQLTAGQQLGTLANDTQTGALKGAAALQSVGETQQANQQQGLNQAYADFLEQRQYPQQQVEWMNNILRGIQPSVSGTNTTTNAPATIMGASPLAQVAGIGSGIGALLSGLSKARGGRVSYARGGRVGALARVAHHG